MDLGLKDKSVIVTAASKGIGKATALGFLQEGARVTICARDQQALEAAREELQAATGGQIVAITADVSDPQQLQTLVSAATAAHGETEVLVNNAGGPPAGSHTDISAQQWQQAFDLTLQSAVRLTELVLPGMKKAGWGRVVNLSSYSVKQPMDNMMLSNSIRLSVLGWAKTLANEVAADGILVNTVCPGWTDTARVASLLQQKSAATGASVDEVRNDIAANVPLGRIASAQEIANVVVFLASNSASYVTGAAIPVDGGAAKVL